ncbi:hypothetical protein, partial [Sphingomonas sp.]|uniref:hypothetical protein n=1 Tax=Sphingomonas sp. TaxID=28214 RepID=UPI002DBF8B0D
MAGLTVDLTLIEPSPDELSTGRLNGAGASGAGEQSTPQVDEVPCLTFGEAYKRYLADPTQAWSARTREAYETSRRLAVSVIGNDIVMSTISRTHVRDYLDVLRFLPRNAAKRFPKLTPRQAAELARERGDVTLISAANANACIGNLSTFLNWAVNEELLARNPIKGLRLPDDTAKKDKRSPFSPAQLRLIFDAPLYRGCLDGERGYARPGHQRPRNARFWVPLIGLHTGMRLNEICQLDVADVRLIDGINCFVVTEASLTGARDKNLKTGASERMVERHQDVALVEQPDRGFQLIAAIEARSVADIAEHDDRAELLQLGLLG